MNKSIFKTRPGRLVPPADTRNAAGGLSYGFTPEHALVQYSVTGCFNSTYYTKPEAQLEKVLELTAQCDPKFIAQVAVYARKRGYMKDMPAFLCATLAKKDVQLLKKVFPKVIDNGLMAKRFAHIIRTGVVGRKSFGSSVRNTLRKWFEGRSDHQLFRDSVGGDVSMKDLIKMIRPKPGNETRNALYAYFLDKKYDFEKLPPLVRQYEAFKKKETTEVPDVPFQFLSSLDIDDAVWREIARNAPWHMTRMNLNTFKRHNVFEGKGGKEMVKLIADRLRDREAIAKSKVFPYQLMAAFAMTEDTLPQEITDALQDAMEIAVENVPVIDGQIYVFPDVSGSMASAITGYRQGSTSKVTCCDVASLVAAVFMRKNPKTKVLPFNGDVVQVSLNSRDSIMTNAKKLTALCNNGTNCSAPLLRLNKEKATGDLCVFISDNESWMDTSDAGMQKSALYRGHFGTSAQEQWEAFRTRNPKAKLACIDITPNAYSPVQQAREDLLNIGGFSDAVFDVITGFYNGDLDASHIVGEIKKIDLDGNGKTPYEAPAMREVEA